MRTWQRLSVLVGTSLATCAALLVGACSSKPSTTASTSQANSINNNAGDYTADGGASGAPCCASLDQGTNGTGPVVCTSASDCCTGNCNNGQCECSNVGGFCANSNDCCGATTTCLLSTTSDGGLANNGLGTCQQPVCQLVGEVCRPTANINCCAGLFCDDGGLCQ